MTTSVAEAVALPGAPSRQDEGAFAADPSAFSAKGLLAHGPVFATGARGGAVFVGDPAALAALGSADAAAAPAGSGTAELAAPFADIDADDPDPFAAHAEAFNAVVYNELFLWIPRYKEAGFSTFRFEDFIDGRVRRLLPSVRLLVLHAAAPLLLGVPFAELPALLGFESAAEVDRAYNAHATKLRPPKLSMPSLFDLEGPGSGGGDPAKLEAALDALARRGALPAAAGGSSGAAVLWQLTSSVEQTAALVCNLLAAAHLHPESAAPLEAEQARALKGGAPDAPITSAILADMPQLDAYARETMRLYPPSRPVCLLLSQPLTLPRAASAAVKLPAGTIVSPEPFVAHFAPANGLDQPRAFLPQRFLGDDADSVPLLPFGTASGAQGGLVGVYGRGADGSAAGARLAVSMAKAVYVQMRRMFDETILGTAPAPEPEGCALFTVSEKVEVLCKPKMYYELQRGVKKLRF